MCATGAGRLSGNVAGQLTIFPAFRGRACRACAAEASVTGVGGSVAGGKRSSRDGARWGGGGGVRCACMQGGNVVVWQVRSGIRRIGDSDGRTTAVSEW